MDTQTTKALFDDSFFIEISEQFTRVLADTVDAEMMIHTRPMWKRIYLRIMWPIWKARSLVMFSLTGNCGNACGYVEPYGFVPEAECPIHDREIIRDAVEAETIACYEIATQHAKHKMK